MVVGAYASMERTGLGVFPVVAKAYASMESKGLGAFRVVVGAYVSTGRRSASVQSATISLATLPTVLYMGTNSRVHKLYKPT